MGVADLWCVMSVPSSASHGGVGGLEFWGLQAVPWLCDYQVLEGQWEK